ncbi:hypothetical protein FRC20_008274 [Serendipita sp. 405]|nr:hypothetical protein FRC15_000404 [Serendipita sp. 397]KAG8830828.1 hypothetical protein FRC20_008274 [Serendipita sp. 405]
MIKSAFVTKAAARERAELMPLGKMGVKLELPPPYDGSSDVREFENWISKLIAWLRLQRLDVLSEEQNEQRLDLLQLSVTGKVSAFLKTRMENMREHRVDPDFRDLVLDMKHRFVNQHSALNAKNRYDEMAQGSKDVVTYYEDLLDAAERLVSYPDQRDVHKLGYRAETTDLETLLETVEAAEEAEAYERRYSDKMERGEKRHHSESWKSHEYSGKTGKTPSSSFSSLKRDDNKKVVSFKNRSEKRKYERDKQRAQS